MRDRERGRGRERERKNEREIGRLEGQRSGETPGERKRGNLKRKEMIMERLASEGRVAKERKKWFRCE